MHRVGGRVLINIYKFVIMLMSVFKKNKNIQFVEEYVYMVLILTDSISINCICI